MAQVVHARVGVASVLGRVKAGRYFFVAAFAHQIGKVAVHLGKVGILHAVFGCQLVHPAKCGRVGARMPDHNRRFVLGFVVVRGDGGNIVGRNGDIAAVVVGACAGAENLVSHQKCPIGLR